MLVFINETISKALSSTFRVLVSIKTPSENVQETKQQPDDCSLTWPVTQKLLY